MTTQEQVSKLQGLLARIQRNAAAPRTGAPLPPPAAFAPPPAMPPAPPPSAPVAAPPPVVAAPTFAAPAPSPDDFGVDDLLDAAPAASPLPVDVDVPLDSIPPVAEVEAEPIPLVNTAPQEPAAPPIDDAFGLDSEVSEVRVTTATREPAVEVTVAAIEAEAEAEPIAAEELSEDDLVEVTEGTPAPAATDVDIDFEDEDEQPPASSQRSKVASTMDEALAAAAEQLDGEHEVPIKTPPPESGPQEAPAPAMAAPAAPDVDALLGGELDIPTRETTSMAGAGPTPEQLGQTIDLEEGGAGPSLELAEHQHEAPEAAAPVEELEVALPGRDVVGGYDESLQPPPEALSDLEAHRRRLEDDIPPPPESLATLPSVQPGAPAPEIIPLQAAPDAPVGPEVVARAVPGGSPETFSTVREPFRPSSFIELLDASLALSGD